MSQKELTIWMACHAFLLIFVFSIFLVIQPAGGTVRLPLLPPSIQKSEWGEWLTRNMSAVSADQWLYHSQSQYLIRNELSATFLRYKAVNTGEDEAPVRKEGLRLPYRDISFEYPPLAIIPILVPGIFVSGPYGYRILYAELASLAYLWALWVFIKIYTDFFPEKSGRGPLRAMMALSILYVFFMGPIIVFRLDAYPVLLVTLALRAAQKNRIGLSGALLAMGVATKLYPLILTPLFLFYWFHKATLKGAFRFIAGFVAAAALIYLPVLLAAPEGYLRSLSYHSERGVEIESLYASYAQIRHLLGEPASVYTRYGSKNIYWSGEYLATQLWIIPSLLGMALGYLHSVFKILRNEGERKAESDYNVLMEGCLLLILAFITFSKVLSVQYILWFFPLFLWVGARRKMVFPLVLQIAIGTQLIYPFFFTDLVHFKPAAIAILLWRNVLLLLLFVSLLDWSVIFQGLKSVPGWFSQRPQVSPS